MLLKPKVLLALVAAGVTAAYVVPIAGTSMTAGGAEPYGGVRVVRL